MPTHNTAFDQMLFALRNDNLGHDLACEKSAKPKGASGSRKLSFYVDSFDREVLEDVSWLMEIITNTVPVPVQELMVKRECDEDGTGKDHTIVVGNLKGEEKTHWALVITGWTPKQKEFNTSMDFRLLENKAEIESVMFQEKHRAMMRAAEHVAFTIHEATGGTNAQKLLAFREVFGSTDAGREILRVWDTAAVGKELSATTPKARARKSSRL